MKFLLLFVILENFLHVGSIVESESGDSLVSSCSQESNKAPDVRLESTPSPDTSSISSSLFVDVQDKVGKSVSLI